jgi:hypothetical protein
VHLLVFLGKLGLISFIPRPLYAEKKISRVLIEYKVRWTAAPGCTIRKHNSFTPGGNRTNNSRASSLQPVIISIMVS